MSTTARAVDGLTHFSRDWRRVALTTDPGNMLVVAGPMVALYIVGIAVAWLFGRARQTP